MQFETLQIPKLDFLFSFFWFTMSSVGFAFVNFSDRVQLKRGAKIIVREFEILFPFRLQNTF